MLVPQVLGRSTQVVGVVLVLPLLAQKAAAALNGQLVLVFSMQKVAAADILALPVNLLLQIRVMVAQAPPTQPIRLAVMVAQVLLLSDTMQNLHLQ